MNGKQGRQKASPQMILAALEHIEKRGSMQGYLTLRRERLTVMKAVTEQGLVVWNKSVAKYELTARGYKRLEEYRHKIATVTVV